jgi:hypothetical protein
MAGRILLVACAIVLGALELVSELRSAAQGRPNIVLITLDTTRADRMGFL